MVFGTFGRDQWLKRSRGCSVGGTPGQMCRFLGSEKLVSGEWLLLS